MYVCFFKSCYAGCFTEELKVFIFKFLLQSSPFIMVRKSIIKTKYNWRDGIIEEVNYKAM
jgi:hypothetical protein